MNGSTLSIIIGLLVIVLTTIGVTLLLSVPFVDDPPAPSTTHGVAVQPMLLPTAVDRAMP